MPDRYGRFDMSDGFGFAQQILNFSDYQKNKENGEQVERGLGMLDSGTTERPEDITNKNWLEAEKGHTESMNLRAKRENLEFSSKVKKKMDEYVPLLKQNNNNFDLLPTKNSVDVAAIGQLAGVYAETEQGKGQIRKNRGEMLAQQYNVFNAEKKQVENSLKDGNKEKAIIGIMEMSKQAPMPYHLDEYDPKTDSFSVKYLDSKGTPKEVNRVSFPDVLQTINNVNEKRFFQQGALHAEAVRQSNLEYRTNPEKHLRAKKKDGSIVTVVPQKNINDLSDVDYIVYSPGNDPYTVHSMGELQKQGFVFESLDAEKKRTDIYHTKAQTGKVYADTQKSYADAKKTATEAQGIPDKLAREKIADMRKALTDSLKPFVKRGLTLDPLDSVYAKADDKESPFYNALNDASKLVDEFAKGTWAPSSGTDRTKLQSAIQAQSLYQNLLNSNVVNEDAQKQIVADGIRNLTAKYGRDKAGQMVFGEKEWAKREAGRKSKEVKFFKDESESASGASAGPQVRREVVPPPASSSIPPKDENPLASYKGNAVVDKNGTVWARDKNGQARRIQEKPPEKIRNGTGRIVDNPEYAKYLESLEYLGLTPDGAGK